MRKALPIFYSALLLTGVNLFLRFISTAFQVFISSRIGAAGMGLLQLVLSIGSMSTVAGMAGIRTGTMYLSAEELGRRRPGNIRWILSGCFTYSILFSTTVCVALWLLAPAIAKSWIGNEAATTALRTFAIFIPTNCLCGVMVGYFTAANQIASLSAVEIAEQFCSMGITAALLIFWSGSDAIRACQAVILGSGIGGCLTLSILIILKTRGDQPPGPVISVRKRLLQVALPLAVADNLKTGINTVENIIVPKRLALFQSAVTPMAAFGTVCGMVFPVLMFPAAILFGLAELLIPELAHCAAAGSSKRIRYLTKRSLKIAMLYGCLFCGILYLSAGPLCQRLYKDSLAGYWLKQYALLIPMLYCDAIADAIIKGLGQQQICVRYNIFTSLLDVILLYQLLPKYAMAGYFFSFTVTHLINFALSYRRLLIITKQKLNILTPVLALLATVTALGLCQMLSGHALRSIIFSILFLCLLSLLKVIGKEDLLWLKGLILAKRYSRH